MRKARYTGAHTAKAETGGPVKKATPHQEKPGEGLPLFRRPREKDRGTLPGEERVFSPETEGAERQAAPSRGNTGRMPKTAPERTGRIAQPATEETIRASLSRTGHIRVETPVFPTRERRRPSRRLIFFLSAVAAALLLAVVAFALRRPIDEGVYEASMAKAVEAYENADLDNALRFLRRAAAVEETDECLKLMARCYEQTGMLDKALELLRSVDASDAWAAERIQTLEQQRAQLRAAETVEVLGETLPPDTTDLVLDGRGLRDADLQEIVKLYALDALSLADNQIMDFSPLAQLGSLDMLDLSGNRITDLSPLQGMIELRTLYLDRNPLGDLAPLYALHNLNSLSIQGCGVGEEARSALAAALPACAILSDTPEEDVSDISLGGQTFRSDVEELDLSGCGIREITALSACKKLRHLDLRGNEISNLQALMNLPRLDTLDVSANQISDLRPLMGIATLRRLKAADNALTDTAALSTMSALQTLDLSGNPLADFSGLRHLTNLTNLTLVDTGLEDEDLFYLSGLTMLKKLAIDDNPDLSNEAFGMLKSSLPGCTISHSELVYSIDIEGTTVASNVRELDLSGCELSDLSGLERLSCLEKLDLSRNQISNLYVMQLMASRGSLRELNLSFNQVSTPSNLTALTALERLNLYGNPLSEIQTLKSMTWLSWLNLGSCGLSEDQIFELQYALPNCEIVLEA